MRGSYVVRRRVANSYLVRQRDRRRRRELALLLLMLLPVAGGVLGYVWLNLQLVTLGYDVHRLERTLRLEQQRERELRVEAAYLSGPEQVRARAERELGMVQGELERLVFIEEVP